MYVYVVIVNYIPRMLLGKYAKLLERMNWKNGYRYLISVSLICTQYFEWKNTIPILFIHSTNVSCMAKIHNFIFTKLTRLLLEVPEVVGNVQCNFHNCH